MHNTFNGWKKLGRVVAFGERGRFENEYGDKMFHRSQTVKKGPTEVIRVYRDPYGRFIRRETEYA